MISAGPAPSMRWAQIRTSARIAFLAGSIGVLTVAVVTGVHMRRALALVALAAAISAIRRAYVQWTRVIQGLLAIILFIPIRRYAFPGNLPFQLEPYRLFVALLVLGWLTWLLVEPRARMRRSGFEGPLAVIITAVLGSIATNTANLSAGNSEMVKALTFFLSYVFVLYIIVSVVVRLDSIEVLVKTLVVGGTVVALGAVVEARSGFNVFNQLPRFFPILRPIADTADLTRFGTSKSRVFASAQHPIALSAAIVMLLPLALYLARRYRQRRWYLCAVVMGMGCVSTVSRTGVVMFLVAILVFFWLRPKEARRMWPALLPALLAIHFVLPGTLGALKQSFFPKGGLVAEQQYGAGTGGHGRLAAVSAAVPMWQQQPFFGRGYGAPVSIWGTENLDDQWLATLLTTGAVGFIGWLWFFVRALRRIGREAKSDRTDRGWLLTSLGASIAAFAAGMMTFDAFAFIQVTFLLFIFVGLASALLVGQTPPKAVD